MTSTIKMNTLLPPEHFVVFEPAPDESVDDQYKIHGPDGDTGVAIQLTGRYLGAGFFDDVEQELWSWPVREADQTRALRGDIVKALAKAKEINAKARKIATKIGDKTFVAMVRKGKLVLELHAEGREILVRESDEDHQAAYDEMADRLHKINPNASHAYWHGVNMSAEEVWRVYGIKLADLIAAAKKAFDL